MNIWRHRDGSPRSCLSVVAGGVGATTCDKGAVIVPKHFQPGWGIGWKIAALLLSMAGVATFWSKC